MEGISVVRFCKIFVLVIVLGTILFTGNKLREYSYASVPLPGDTADEYMYGWLGISLVKEKYPIAWSGISAYKNHNYEKINVDGLYDREPLRPLFSIDKPWFDHPPLFGLVTGGYAYFKGVREFVDASVIILRRPMLKIALVTTVLIFLLGYKLYGLFVGFVSSLLYSVIPTLVISSRLALAENGYIPLFLISILLAYKYLEKKKVLYWILASFFASVAILFKLSAVAIFMTLIFVAVRYGEKGRYRLMLISTIFTMIVVIVWFGYGAYYGWDTFLRVLLYNSQRFYGAGAEIFHQVVNSQKITTDKFLTDGWILMGWISFFLLNILEWGRKRGGEILVLALISYVFTFLIFGSEAYGWYRFPFYPFLTIAIARLFQRLIVKPNLSIFLPLILLPFGTTVHRLVAVIGFQEYVSTFRYFITFTIFVFILNLLIPKKGKIIGRLYIIITISIVIWLSIKGIYNWSIENWYFVT